MRKWMPSKTTIGIWLAGTVLAIISLPDPSILPQSGDTEPRPPAQAAPHLGAIPTMAEITLDDQDDQAVVQPIGDPAVAGHFAKTAAAQQQSVEAAAQVQQPSDNATPQQQPGNAPHQKPGNTQRQPGNTPHQKPGNTQQQPLGGTAPSQPTPGVVPHHHAPGAAPDQQQPGTPPSGQPGNGIGPGQQTPGNVTPSPIPGAQPGTKSQFSPYVPWPTAKLRIRVIDGRTLQPLPGAEVVVIETEQRLTTDDNGYTQYVDAPIIRNPRYRPMVQELHGQLGVIAYKNGYRDSVHLGIRMHEGYRSDTTVWMYKLGPGDTRVEPVLYQVPYHHLWLVELADKFRSKTQPGEGPQRP